MSFKVNQLEQQALCGLPHLQQLLYLMALRPYMDYSTGIVGLKRGISYQSVGETLYVEPHQGYGGGSPSRDQLRRAFKGLVRAGLLVSRSAQKQLIFYCPKAMQDFSVQNKAATKPPYQAATKSHGVFTEKTNGYENPHPKAAMGKTAKAATPLVSGILFTHTTRAREKKNHPLSFSYTPSETVLATARQLQCAGASPTQEPWERAKFISFHLARNTVRHDWDAEYLGWLLRTVPTANHRGEHGDRTSLSSSPCVSSRVVAAYSSPRQRPISVGGAMDRVLEANRDLLDFFNQKNSTGNSPQHRNSDTRFPQGGFDDHGE